MDDIIKRLEQVANFKVGDIVDGFGPKEWGVTLSKLCGDAADEIKRLRAMVALQATMVTNLEEGLNRVAANNKKVSEILNGELNHG